MTLSLLYLCRGIHARSSDLFSFSTKAESRSLSLLTLVYPLRCLFQICRFTVESLPATIFQAFPAVLPLSIPFAVLSVQQDETVPPSIFLTLNVNLLMKIFLSNPTQIKKAPAVGRKPRGRSFLIVKQDRLFYSFILLKEFVFKPSPFDISFDISFCVLS